MKNSPTLIALEFRKMYIWRSQVECGELMGHVFYILESFNKATTNKHPMMMLFHRIRVVFVVGERKEGRQVWKPRESVGHEGWNKIENIFPINPCMKKARSIAFGCLIEETRCFLWDFSIYLWKGEVMKKSKDFVKSSQGDWAIQSVHYTMNDIQHSDLGSHKLSWFY